jgi:hypothetical protein
MHALTTSSCLYLASFSLAVAQANLPSSLSPNGDSPAPLTEVKQTQSTKSKPFKLPKGKLKYSPVYEYYVRMEKVAKERQKVIRELSKPQYSDFSYFGHRRPPKRRPFHKMRYCAECGIRH